MILGPTSAAFDQRTAVCGPFAADVRLMAFFSHWAKVFYRMLRATCGPARQADNQTKHSNQTVRGRGRLTLTKGLSQQKL